MSPRALATSQLSNIIREIRVLSEVEVFVADAIRGPFIRYYVVGKPKLID